MRKATVKQRSDHSDVLRDALKYAPATLIPAMLGVVSAAVFTRIFLPREYGVVVLINSVTGPVVSIVSELFGQPLGRYFSETVGSGSETVYANVLSKILRLLVVSVAGVLLLISVVLAIMPHGTEWFLILLSAGIGLGVQVASSLLVQLLPLIRDFSGYRIYGIWSAVLAVAIPLVLMWALGPNIAWMIVGVTIAGLIMLVPLMRRIKRSVNLRLTKPRFESSERDLLRRFLRYGAPMTIWFFCAIMIQGSDRYVIGAYLGSGAVAIYGSSYNIAAQTVGLLTGPLVTAVWPNVINTWTATKDVVAVQHIIAKATNIYLTIGIGMVGGSAVIGREVVRVLLAPQYASGYVVLPPVMAGVVLWGASIFGHKSMEVMERNDLMIKNAAIAASANLVLNIVLVPRLGWHVAAYTTLLSYAAYTVATWTVARRLIPWNIDLYRVGFNLGAACLGVAVVAQLPVSSVFDRGLIYCSLYGGFALLWQRMNWNRYGGRGVA